MSPPPPAGRVQLNLCPEKDFCLNIPINIITDCCLKPFAYLRFVGWCVLGALGELRDSEGNAVSLDEEQIQDQTVYEYHLENGLQHAVDPEVIRLISSVPTTDTDVRVPFRQLLLPRDGEFCIWTGLSVIEGMHIIPFARGDELMLQNRPNDGENLEGIHVNDIRNGISASGTIHKMFEARKVVVLVTPNPILTCDDIPPKHVRPEFQPGVSYPANSRYTLQWITSDIDNLTRTHIGHNNDATFFDQSLPKPSSMLLHYNYGAAMVCLYGVNKEVLLTRPGPPVPVPTGPTRTIGDRSRTIEKLDQARTTQGMGRGRGRGVSGTSRAMDGTVESSEQRVLDGDEIVLRFWASTRVAQERRAKEEEERRERLENWRTAVISY